VAGLKKSEAVRERAHTASEDLAGTAKSEEISFSSEEQGLQGEQTRVGWIYEGPQPPVSELAEVAEPTPIATGCDTMPW